MLGASKERGRGSRCLAARDPALIPLTTPYDKRILGVEVDSMKRHFVLGFLCAAILIVGVADTCEGTQATNSSNVGTFCDHGNRVYDDNSGHGLAVVPADPSCQKQ